MTSAVSTPQFSVQPPPLRFVLNEVEVKVDVKISSGDLSGGLTVLDFVRRSRQLCGTKEGCKEGDCGACAVLVGELTASGTVRYLPVTSCMMPIAEAAGKHLVTIEGLDVGRATTVQREIVAMGASQCGFCTPGIAVSLIGRLMDGAPPAARDETLPAEVDRALSGHLCRCTGYRSLRAAATAAFRQLAESQGVEALVAAGELPAWFLRIPARLQELQRLQARPEAPEPRLAAASRPWVAGGTDLYVQRGEQLPVEEVVALDSWLPRRPELRGIRLEGDSLLIGALTRFEDLAESDVMRRQIPAIGDFMQGIASWQIRNRATVGGNLINASPIGDVTILMLALGAVALFEDTETAARRELPLDQLYLGYKKLDRRPTEVLIGVRIPTLRPQDVVDFEKVSKRRCLDIATVNTAIRLRVEGDTLVAAGLAAGGVAPVPLFLRRTSAALIGRRVDLETVSLALRLAQDEISPISDVRGSADYKRLLVRNLLVAHFTKLFPDQLREDDTFAALCA